MFCLIHKYVYLLAPKRQFKSTSVIIQCMKDSLGRNRSFRCRLKLNTGDIAELLDLSPRSVRDLFKCGYLNDTTSLLMLSTLIVELLKREKISIKVTE